MAKYVSPFEALAKANSSASDSSGGDYTSPFHFLNSTAVKQHRKDLATAAETGPYNADAIKKAQAGAPDAGGGGINVGHIVAGIGHFFKSAAKDVKDTTVGTWQGLGDVARGELAGRQVNKNTKLLEDRSKEFHAKFGTASDAQWADPNFQQKAKDFVARTKQLTKVDTNTTQDLAAEQKVNAHKLAFQTGESVLNFGTLGLGAPIKAIAKQGLKQLGTAALKEALRVGGKDAMDTLIKHAGEQTVKDTATEMLQTGGKKLVKDAATFGTLGAGYGVTSTGKNEDAHLKDYLLNAAFGAGAGAVLPFAGAALKRAGQKVVGKLRGPTATVTEDTAASTAAKPGATAEKPTDLNTIMNQAVDEQQGKYGHSVLDRVKNWVSSSVIDPYYQLAKVDKAYAKANGLKHSEVTADQSLENLARKSASSENEAKHLFDQKTSTGESAKDLVIKYGGDTEAGKEFNNYSNAKFDLEFRQKHPGKQIQPQFDDKQLQDFVSSYEAKNKNAVTDLATKKGVNDMAVDYMVTSGAISKMEGETIKRAYKHAVPLERIFPEDLARPQVTGKNIGSISKQTVIQRLEGGSDIPLSNSFDTLLNRVYKAVSQGNRAKLAAKILERTQQGHIHADLLVGAGNKEARMSVREEISQINKGVRYLNKRVSISNKQARRLATEINNLNKSGLSASLRREEEPSLAGKLADPGVATTPAETKNIVGSLMKMPSSDIKAIQSKIATREPKLAEKLDQVISYKAKIEANQAAKQDLKGVVAELGDDPTTGKQVVSGLIDGQTFKIEVPPELATALQGLDQQRLPSVLKALAIAKKPFEIAWTGILNPVFSAMSFAFYDTPMSVINSPQGFKTFAPKAIKESVKALVGKSDLQQKLAAAGALPFGGSMSSASIRVDSRALAAQKNILTKLKFSVKNPQHLLSTADVLGGKLANATRVRIARAAYDDALSRGLSENAAVGEAYVAWRTVMPDYETIAGVTRQINSVIPFFAASVGGTRALGKALARDPLGTGAKALAIGIAPAIGITAYSLMSPNGQKFYADMERAKKTYLLDNNFVIVLPGAHKDDATGQWTGIIKVPIAPEFRSVNASAWREVRAAMGKGKGMDASRIALGLFDTATGQVRTSENPLISTTRILAGQDPNTGEPLVRGSLADLPKSEQKYTTTTKAGERVARVFGTSPIQGDKILGQFGVAGQVAKTGKPIASTEKNIGGRFSGAYGESAQRSFFSTYTPIKARRDRISTEVTDLVKQGKVGEARRKAKEFNDSLPGSFSGFSENYSGSNAYDPHWNDLLNGLQIRTNDKSLAARTR